MIATLTYFYVVLNGADITESSLLVTAFVDLCLFKAASEMVKSWAMARANFVPMPVDAQAIEGDEELEDMALTAEEVDERYGN